MTTTTPAEPPEDAQWWKTTPNPPCEPWCTIEHKPGEFANGGGMLCRHSILDTHPRELREGVQVDVQRNQCVSASGRSIDKQNVEVWLEGPSCDDQLTPETAQLLGASLLAAAAFVRAVQS